VALALVLLIVVAVAVLAVLVVVIVIVLRRPRQDAKIVGFRRHIDALSPESRREVQDRMREQQARPDPDPDGGRG
jgi:hypothetical protein